MSALKNKQRAPAPAVDYPVRALLNAFAHNLRDRRTEHGWSIRLAAKKLGVAESTWSQWESGKRFPSPDFLNLIGILFNTCPCLLIMDCLRCLRDCAHKPQATSHKPQATSHKPQAEWKQVVSANILRQWGEHPASQARERFARENG